MATNPQMADIGLGNRIRLARIQRSMTIKALAAEIGVSRDSLSDYENEVTDPPATVISRLAVVLDTSADWLLFGATRAFLRGSHLSSPERPSAQGRPGEAHPAQPIQGVLTAVVR